VRLLKKQDFDVFHPTYYEPYFLKYIQKKPFVLTVYDMIHEHFPNYFKTNDQTRAWKKQLIENAGAIIAISENTKQDILKFTDVNPDRVHVIYLGNPFEKISSSSQINPYSSSPVFEKPYLLFVGGRTSYKNFDFFIESVAGILCKDEELHVVCAGSSPFTNKEKTTLKNLDILHKVHHVKIDDTILKNLYRNARAFIFPSLYEGFGLPVLEAFSCGCPIMLSNTSSLPEIGGNAAIYFDPYDSTSLSETLEHLISDDTLRLQLVQKGYERLKLFSWEITAQKTKKIYDSLMK
jgi:glycosyltransferase involved in cell wall biosynthesis